MNPIKFIIAYPSTQEGKKEWNKQYSLNSLYSTNKNFRERTCDKNYWHNLVQTALLKSKIPKVMFEVPVKIVFYWNDLLDCSNHAYMAKMIEDALCGWVIKNDNRKYVIGFFHLFHSKGDYIGIEISEYKS